MEKLGVDLKVDSERRGEVGDVRALPGGGRIWCIGVIMDCITSSGSPSKESMPSMAILVWRSVLPKSSARFARLVFSFCFCCETEDGESSYSALDAEAASSEEDVGGERMSIVPVL